VLARDTTLFVTTSPRRNDATTGATELIRNVEATLRTLSLHGATIAVLFDGVRGRLHDLSHDAKLAYTAKVTAVRAWGLCHTPPVQVLLFEWALGKAEVLWAAFNATAAEGKATPIVGVLEDDSEVGGHVDAYVLHAALRYDPAVEWVRFLWYNDCVVKRGAFTIPAPWDPAVKLASDAWPCTPMHESGKLLKTSGWADRPHLCKWAHYPRRVFPLVERGTRRAPESYVFCKARFLDNVTNWGMWNYGERNHMLHDIHHSVNGSSYDVRPGVTSLSDYCVFKSRKDGYTTEFTRG
jgi:hypothetical protein